jgi:hypothetical protein
MEDVEMTGMERESRPLLTQEEKRILEVYDRLEELQLEIALLKAQGVLSEGEWVSILRKYTPKAYGFQMSLWMSPRKSSPLPGKNF